MLLIHNDMPHLAKMAPAEMQRVMAQYQAWNTKMAQSGKLAGGEKLREEGGRHLSAKGGKLTVRDGPYAEAKEVVGGYFLLDAKDYAEATSLCEDCPALAAGGRIELREIEKM
ncbi:MAG: YciI family protein [Gemmatimonadetes bacterium]|nr:YciI family protein [Gemmatimonadota bacterium]